MWPLQIGCFVIVIALHKVSSLESGLIMIIFILAEMGRGGYGANLEWIHRIVFTIVYGNGVLGAR
jgi:hypothetical protein